MSSDKERKKCFTIVFLRSCRRCTIQNRHGFVSSAAFLTCTIPVADVFCSDTLFLSFFSPSLFSFVLLLCVCIFDVCNVLCKAWWSSEAVHRSSLSHYCCCWPSRRLRAWPPVRRSLSLFLSLNLLIFCSISPQPELILTRLTSSPSSLLVLSWTPSENRSQRSNHSKADLFFS